MTQDKGGQDWWGSLAAFCPMLELPLFWERAEHRGPSLGQGSCRAVWERGQAAQNCSSAVACPALVQDTCLWHCCHQEQTSCVFQQVLYEPLSSQTSVGTGTCIGAGAREEASCPPQAAPAQHKEPGIVLALTGSTLLGKHLQITSSSFLGTHSQ